MPTSSATCSFSHSRAHMVINSCLCSYAHSLTSYAHTHSPIELLILTCQSTDSITYWLVCSFTYSHMCSLFFPIYYLSSSCQWIVCGEFTVDDFSVNPILDNKICCTSNRWKHFTRENYYFFLQLRPTTIVLHRDDLYNSKKKKSNNRFLPTMATVNVVCRTMLPMWRCFL